MKISRWNYVPVVEPEIKTKASRKPQKRMFGDAFPSEHGHNTGVEEAGYDIPSDKTAHHDDRFVVLGDLVLPRPPAEYQERAERLEPLLQQLNSRNMHGKIKHTLSA